MQRLNCPSKEAPGPGSGMAITQFGDRIASTVNPTRKPHGHPLIRGSGSSRWGEKACTLRGILHYEESSIYGRITPPPRVSTPDYTLHCVYCVLGVERRTIETLSPLLRHPGCRKGSKLLSRLTILGVQSRIGVGEHLHQQHANRRDDGL